MYRIDFNILLQNAEFIGIGIKTTVFICAISAVFAFAVGTIISFLRQRANKFTSKSMIYFVELIRNTPLLIQLYVLYKGFPQIEIFGHSLIISPVWCGIIALSIYTGVYLSEVIRAGINSIHPQQKNAAYALGLSDIQVFIYIIYPQAIRNVIPALGSQFINLIKNSTLVSFISVTDIFYVMYQGISDYFRLVEFMTLGIVLYCSLTGVVAVLTHVLEKRFNLKMTEVKI